MIMYSSVQRSCRINLSTNLAGRTAFKLRTRNVTIVCSNSQQQQKNFTLSVLQFQVAVIVLQRTARQYTKMPYHLWGVTVLLFQFTFTNIAFRDKSCVRTDTQSFASFHLTMFVFTTLVIFSTRGARIAVGRQGLAR